MEVEPTHGSSPHSLSWDLVKFYHQRALRFYTFFLTKESLPSRRQSGPSLAFMDVITIGIVEAGLGHGMRSKSCCAPRVDLKV